MPFALTLWLCLATSPQCDLAHSVAHIGPAPAQTALECQSMAAAAKATVPDPPGYISGFKCENRGTPV